VLEDKERDHPERVHGSSPSPPAAPPWARDAIARLTGRGTLHLPGGGAHGRPRPRDRLDRRRGTSRAPETAASPKMRDTSGPSGGTLYPASAVCGSSGGENTDEHRPATRRQAWWPVLAGLLLGMLAMGPALVRGFVLSYDMVFVPDPPLSSALLGLAGGPA